MIAGGGRFDPDRATALERFIFRVVVGDLGTGIAVLSAILVVVGLTGDADKLAGSVVGLLGLAASVWWWRRIDRRMTRAIEARRSERPPVSGEATGKTGMS